MYCSFYHHAESTFECVIVRDVCGVFDVSSCVHLWLDANTYHDGTLLSKLAADYVKNLISEFRKQSGQSRKMPPFPPQLKVGAFNASVGLASVCQALSAATPRRSGC